MDGAGMRTGTYGRGRSRLLMISERIGIQQWLARPSSTPNAHSLKTVALRLYHPTTSPHIESDQFNPTLQISLSPVSSSARARHQQPPPPPTPTPFRMKLALDNRVVARISSDKNGCDVCGS
eukprot:6186152-Pleurochrysis_carterae.AAC.1